MRKRLLILSVAISFSAIACTGNPANAPDGGSAGSNGGGGSVNRADSLKKPGAGINVGSSNNLGLSDTITPARSPAYPFTDTAKKKKP
ncbi:MAG: hypothetical protein JWP78_863 [Mucilaginibacter sp.]|nr:hypothetical protein [Mucilaginibacter sp.]